MTINCKYLLDILWSRDEIRCLESFTSEKCDCGDQIGAKCEVYYCHCERIRDAVLNYMALYFLIFRYFDCKCWVLQYVILKLLIIYIYIQLLQRQKLRKECGQHGRIGYITQKKKLSRRCRKSLQLRFVITKPTEKTCKSNALVENE
jgi:hypothetical protein